MLQYADAYKKAMAKEKKPVSDADALRWAKTSVSRSPQDMWVQLYTANRRAFEDDDTACRIADEITQAVAGYQSGSNAQTPQRDLSLNPVGSAEAAEPGLYERAWDFLGFGGTTSQPNPPGAAGNPLMSLSG